MQLPKQPLMLYVNDKIYLPNPAEPGAFVPASPEAAAALEAKDAEIARKDAAIREHIAFMESTGFSTRFLDGLRAALSATTKE